MRRKSLNQTTKLNLIPILDAIFIFIFFLLMSAQFIDMYEINSDAPITSTTSLFKNKEPLNLTLELKDDNITITTGLNNKIYKKISFQNLEELNRELINIKQKNKDENSIVIKPTSNFPYHKVIKIIDYSSEVVTSKKINNPLSKIKLFDQIIFDTQE